MANTWNDVYAGLAGVNPQPPTVGGFTAPGNWDLTAQGWHTAGGVPAVVSSQPGTSSGAVSQVSRNDLQQTFTPSENRQATVAGLDALLPIPYGHTMLRAIMPRFFDFGGGWTFFILWAEGPIDSIVKILIDDKPLPPEAVVHSYLGSQTQTLDQLLVDAYNSVGLTWTYTLPGIAYSVIFLPYTSINGPPRFNAEVKGRKLYDPRLDSTNGGTGSHRLNNPTTWAWTDNPTLIATDFEINPVYGAGNVISDWASVIACANYNDVTVGTAPTSEKKRVCDIAIDREATVDNWRETLRAAASVFRIENQGAVKFIADQALTPSFSYSHADGNIGMVGEPKFKDLSNLPTITEVTWTDSSSYPWRDSTVTFKRKGVDEGVLPPVKATVRMPWIRSGSQARREAIERNNKQIVRSMALDLEVFDEGLKQEPGDIGTLTYPDYGINVLPMRVTATRETPKGWMLSLEKEDPAGYNDSVEVQESIPTTDFPSPSLPPAITGLTIAEEVYQVQTGMWGSRLIITWNAVVWPFTQSLFVEVYQGTELKDSGTLFGYATKYVTKDLTENLLYTVKIQVISVTGAKGPAATGTYTNSGRLNSRPTDVPAITGLEVAGELRLVWTPATDLDLTAHEIRYGAVGSTWATATLLDRVAVPQTRYSTRVLTPGVYVFHIKGLDSVRTPAFPYGQESLNAKASAAITITSDANAFLAASYKFTSVSLTSNVSPLTGPVF